MAMSAKDIGLCQLSDLHAGPIYGTDKLRLLGSLATPGSPWQVLSVEGFHHLLWVLMSSWATSVS